jgi:hypothetical protein
VAAAAALADVVLMIAAVVGAVLRVARNLATTSGVSARVMFGLHGGSPDGRGPVMHLRA